MCGRFHLAFLPDADELFEHLFNIPFPQFEYPPILSNDILPCNVITTIYSNFDQPLSKPMFWNLMAPEGGDEMFIVMEYIEGHELKEIVGAQNVQS